MLSTKIVATIGPTSDSEERIAKLYENGMRVARLNFSHGDHNYFKKIIRIIRSVSKDIAIMIDTKGPEIRTGDVINDEIELNDEDEIVFTNKKVVGNDKKITINYKKLNSLKKNDCILIDDGLIEAHVIKKQGDDILARVVNGGKLGSKKTVSLRGHNVEVDFLSKKDKEDINFAIENNLDYIAASFVRVGKDVRDLRKFLDKKNSKMRIISKIEHWEAVENVDEIIKNSQGIMIARGDLGVEVPMEKVPIIQKKIIKKCNLLGIPVIVATQMLESMKQNPRPTRAEIADVAQAILDGADAVMLSGETANGKYPIKSIKMMATIAREYEKLVETTILEDIHSEKQLLNNSISMFVTRAAFLASNFLETSAIITPTESGYTARKVSRFKPKVPIYAMVHDEIVLRQLQLSWGVFPFKVSKKSDVDKMVYEIILYAHDKKLVEKNDKVIITSGHLAKSGHTNTLEIYKVETILEKVKKR